MKNEAARRLRMLADYLKTQDAYLQREGVEILNDVANEIDAHLAEHDDLMLKVLAAPQAKTLRDEWAMALIPVAQAEHTSDAHFPHPSTLIRESYQFADQAIAISKET